MLWFKTYVCQPANFPRSYRCAETFMASFTTSRNFSKWVVMCPTPTTSSWETLSTEDSTVLRLFYFSWHSRWVSYSPGIRMCFSMTDLESPKCWQSSCIAKTIWTVLASPIWVLPPHTFHKLGILKIGIDSATSHHYKSHKTPEPLEKYKQVIYRLAAMMSWASWFLLNVGKKA